MFHVEHKTNNKMKYRIVVIAAATSTVMDLIENATFEEVILQLAKYHGKELYAVNVQTIIKYQ